MTETALLFFRRTLRFSDHFRSGAGVSPSSTEAFLLFMTGEIA